MIIHLPTGKKFHNRKEAKIYFGTAYYYKMEREKKYLVFTNNVIKLGRSMGRMQ